MQNDDVNQLIARLNNGKGAFVICSHLGNSEILRNLANNNQIFVNKNIKVSVLMDLKSTKMFTNTVTKLNPRFTDNIIDINDINPGTIEILQDTIDSGGLVVIAGDRNSKDIHAKKVETKFLGKKAFLSYGVFLIAILLKSPIYYMFGLREKDVSYNRKYNVFIKKSIYNIENISRKDRETYINNICLEYINELEKYCKEYPLQWYNFYDFWKE